jgi:hypothetical protein
MLDDPLNTPGILMHVGPAAFFGWFGHYMNLVLYTVAHSVLKGTKDPSILGARLRYRWNRFLEVLEFGSGMDYKLD